MESIYKINLVPSDLSTEETVLQIADTLDNLNGIVDDVFARLLGRIKQNVDKTSKLKSRIEVSKSKVDKLTGMQKAIKVFSSAKYPASIAHEHYHSIFDLDGYSHKPQKVTLSGKTQAQPNDKGIQEKLHFFHVRVADTKNTNIKPDYNLKAVIDRLPTVGELLVFETDDSLYLGKTSKVTTYVPAVNPVIENENSLEAAPSSIMKRDILKREIDEYMYTPGMGVVPELEMPLDLPHLPGIAGDLQFSMISDGSIAPSVVTSPVAPSASWTEPALPELPDLKELPDVKLPDLEVLPEIKLPAEVVPDLLDAPAPPPPPPSALVPPPPPPPPPPPMEEKIIPDRSKSQQSAPAPVVGDAHANLMAAIRQAGGAGRAKLKSAVETTASKGTKSSGGDLMADLHAKLSMRRRGISGAERSGGSVLHTLASIIPEPGEQSSPQRSSSDDDWE